MRLQSNHLLIAKYRQVMHVNQIFHGGVCMEFLWLTETVRILAVLASSVLISFIIPVFSFFLCLYET